MKRSLFTLLAFVFIVVLLAASLGALTNPSPNLSPSLPKTNDTINCAWANSTDLTWFNVTLLQDGAVYVSVNTTNTSIEIPSSATSKGELWTCRVRAYNASTSTQSEAADTIRNTPPDTTTAPNGLFNSSGDDIGRAYTVAEDLTFTLDFNATDVDADSLIYGFGIEGAEFCSVTNSSAGLFSCTPTQADLDGNNAKITNITFLVTDGEDNSGPTVSFNVTPVNDAPTISSVENGTTPVNVTWTYDLTASDEEGNTVAFWLINEPAEIATQLSIVTNGNTGTVIYNVSGGPYYEDVNTSGWPITVRVNDTGGAFNDYSFLLNITAVGRTPTIINYTPNMTNNYFTIAEDSGLFQVNISANDSDTDDVHTYSLASTPANMDVGTIVANVNATNVTLGQINFTPTNDNVATFSITLRVRDQELLEDTLTLNFNVTNTQDAPIIYNESFNTNNTNNNNNLSNVTSYATAPLVFVVNATDVDVGDTLTFGDNTSLFDINSSTGVISFTPDSSDIQGSAYSILINVTDGTTTVEAVMNLWILANTPPYFSPVPLPTKQCPEASECSYDVANYSQEDDAGDSIASYSLSFIGQSIANFSYSTSTGLVNFTPLQTDIAAYTVNATITDQRGASNSTTFVINITNTPETPDLTIFDFSNQTIVETKAFSFTLQATDNDLYITNTSENLTFQDNLTFTTIRYDRTTGDTVYAVLTMTPTGTEVGNHSIRINVTDADGLSDEEVFTFEIYEDTLAPEVREVKPYGNASNSYAIADAFINVSDLGANSTRLTLSENTTYKFAHVTWDEYIAALTTTWYYDDVQVSTDWNYTKNFNYFSSGSHQVKLFVEDNRLENATFLWNLTVSDVNRAPQLLNNLSNIPAINTTYVYANYLGRHNSTTYFYDADDDPDGNYIINGSETDRLTYSVTQCLSGGAELATITITDTSIAVAPLVVGTCQVVFTATDPGTLSLQSNTIRINVTAVPEGSNETVVEESPSGGGGTTTRTSYVPITQETETPEPINIIAPKVVTIYDNASMIIPFDVKNTWYEDLSGISLLAETNASAVSTNLSLDFIEGLPVNETVEVNLLVSNYRMGENYEINIKANISNPEFEDEALIILTSIEQASEGDEVEVKVTFARDLFNEHPECQELNELLEQANQELASNNFVGARRYVDTAINGCKYIVSSLSDRTERPDQLSGIITLDELTFQTIIYLALAFLVVITIAFIIYYHYTTKESDDI